MSFSCTLIVLQIKFISMWKVVYQDEFWKIGKINLKMACSGEAGLMEALTC